MPVDAFFRDAGIVGDVAADDTPETSRGLSIGQVAERTGLSVHTLRFYERAGVLANPVARETTGRRVYSDEDVEWLEICSKLRSSGMPLAAIRRYADLVRLGPGNEEDRLALLRQHQERVTAQIAELTECLNVISYKVKVYEDSVARGTAGRLWIPSSQDQCLPAQDQCPPVTPD